MIIVSDCHRWARIPGLASNTVVVTQIPGGPKPKDCYRLRTGRYGPLRILERCSTALRTAEPSRSTGTLSTTCFTMWERATNTTRGHGTGLVEVVGRCARRKIP